MRNKALISIEKTMYSPFEESTRERLFTFETNNTRTNYSNVLADLLKTLYIYTSLSMPERFISDESYING